MRSNIYLTLDTPPLPVRVDIEPTTHCNFRCKICQRTYWKRESADMSFSQFKRLLQQIPTIRQLKLQGMGEPLLNKEFFDMVAYAKAVGIEHVSTFTNGSLLFHDNNVLKLVNSGIDLIRISIDASNQERLKVIKPGANLMNILRGVEALSNLIYSKNRTLVEFWTVITSENIDDCINIIDLAKSLNISTVNFQIILNTFEYKPEIQNKLIPMKPSRESLSSMINSAKEYANKASIILKIQDSKKRSRENPCHWPFDSTFISVEGFVVPCCTIADPNIANMGNAFLESFEEIWAGIRYQEFRKLLINHRFHNSCLNCYSN